MLRVVEERGPKLLKIQLTFSGKTPSISVESANCASKCCVYESCVFLTIFTRELHEGDPEYIVTTYSTSTGTTTRRKHLFQVHTQCYIEALERNRWPIYIPALKEAIEGGWTLGGILQALKDPTKTIGSLGPPPNRGSSDSLPGPLGPQDKVLPAFSLDEMHRQLVKFIVADDQVSHLLSTCFCS